MDITLNQIYCVLILFILQMKGCLTQITIELTTPVNPVEQNGILSIHCQVSHLNSEQHEVTILRTINNNPEHAEKLSVDEGVLSGVDDRVFLAVRKLVDGSTVYFLSITEVQRSDEGNYYCKVLTKGVKIEEIGSESVHIGVMYYPDDTQPDCSPEIQGPINAGTTLILNCSSDMGNPKVTLEWSNTIGKALHDTSVSEYVQNNRVISTITYRLKNDDDGAVFVCKMSSVNFPEEEQSCHVGPFKVIKNNKLPMITDLSNDRRSNEVTTLSTFVKNNNNDIIRQQTSSNCKDVCPVNSKVIYWIAATIIAAGLSLIFFIAAITLLVKYLHTPRVKRSHYITARHTPDDIYSELECRRLGEGKVYMSLDKSAIKPPNTSPSYGIHYHEMPETMKVAVPSN